MTYEEYLKLTSPSSFALGVNLSRAGFSWECSGVNEAGQWCGASVAVGVTINVYMDRPSGRSRNLVGVFKSFAEFEAQRLE